MNPSKLSKFEPGLQIQLFLTVLFRLHHVLNTENSTLTSNLLIKIEEPDSPWIENLGILHQLKLQVEHLLIHRPKEHLSGLHQGLLAAIEECKKKEIKHHLASCSWPENLFNLAASFLISCEPDENLYYFLLRHQEECKKIFGRLFLLNLFKDTHQMEKFLIDRYQKRGFSHLKSMIRKHLIGLAQC